jgi:hypothetical protein
LIDGRNDKERWVGRGRRWRWTKNSPFTVDIVEEESELCPFFETSSTQNRKTSNELGEVDCSCVINIKCVEQPRKKKETDEQKGGKRRGGYEIEGKEEEITLSKKEQRKHWSCP